MQPRPWRFSFGTMLLLLLMVIAAGIGTLGFYALQVPAITSELNGWLGRPDAVIDRGEGRRAQVIFALFVYTAPLALGMFVYLFHHLINWILRVLQEHSPSEDDPFRMD